METLNGLVPQPQWLKIGKDTSAVEVPLEVQGVPVPHWAPKPRVPGQKEKVLTTSGCEKQVETVAE